jgi:hypothetical protein
MKIKLPVFFLTIFLSLFLAASPIRAAEFKLTSIGSLDVSDGVYSQMWYTGNQPAFSGTGTSGATVSITVDSDSYSTTVGTDEQWSWMPATVLTSGDHSLTFTSGTETISFALTTGSSGPTDLTTPTSTAAATTSALPETGFLTPTLLVLAVAGLLLAAPLGKKLGLKKISS